MWDASGASATSEAAWFEMGLLKRSDWKAKWIGAALRGGARSSAPAPYLRKSFTLPDNIAGARLYVTALGLHECTINGKPVSEDVFAPGWTDYNKRIQYNVYDVTELLQRRRKHAGRHPGRRLGGRPYRLGATASSTSTAPACWPSWRSRPPPAPRSPSPATAPGSTGTAPCSTTTC